MPPASTHTHKILAPRLEYPDFKSSPKPYPEGHKGLKEKHYENP